MHLINAILQDFHDPMFDSGPKKHMFELMMSDTPLPVTADGRVGNSRQ